MEKIADNPSPEWGGITKEQVDAITIIIIIVLVMFAWV